MEATSVPHKRWQFSLRILFGAVTVVATLLGAWTGCVRWQFPYGHSHCCDMGLMSALHSYAGAHGGNFPSGEATPEASLSLLYPQYADANLLRGKTVPESEVAAILMRGKLLGPESCGWHYIAGLAMTDDPRLALFWDKVGLGHNGQRLSPHGRHVFFVNFERRFVLDSEWDEFTKEQEELLAARLLKSSPATGATP